MSWTTAAIDWAASTRNYATEKFRTPRKAPPYVGLEVGDDADLLSLWSGFSDDKKMGGSKGVMDICQHRAHRQ